jgi:uncharacterized protein (DUF1697 family)
MNQRNIQKANEMEDQSIKYIALLRGINVGGKNILPKKLLIQSFHDLGYHNIITYIQSGNILFRSKETDSDRHMENIEVILSNKFSIQTRSVVYTETQYKSIVNNAPDNWGKDENYRHRILFLLGNTSPKEIIKHLGIPHNDVETITMGSRVIYSSVSKAHLSKSVLRKFPTTPAYRQVTIRNQNTVYKINQLFEII